MCDYSLHTVPSRPAEVGETLVSTGFLGTNTRGFAAANDRHCLTAVCLLPGTELAFEEDARYHGMFWPRSTKQKVARFRRLNPDVEVAHHDALEFGNGKVILVTNLVAGQKVTVLQLPHDASQDAQRASEAGSPADAGRDLVA